MSRFVNNNNYNNEIFGDEIDFEDAIRLPDGGST